MTVTEIATLDDYLTEGLDVVFVGLNPSLYSARVGHYFANPRNRFWAALNRSGLVDVGATGRSPLLTPQDDRRLSDYGIGFTDVAKRPTPQGASLRISDFRQGAPALKAKLLRYQPRIACFHGLVAYRAYLLYGEIVKEKAALGLQERTISKSRIFVVPNPSPANARFSLDTLVDWYQRLKALREDLSG